MATWATVSRIAKSLAGTVESETKQGLLQWHVGDKALAWHRPLRRSDLEALGDDAPKGAILGVYVPDLETKDVLVTQRSEIYFTTPHFEGHASVLVRLAKISAGELKALLTESWESRRVQPKPRPRKKKR